MRISSTVIWASVWVGAALVGCRSIAPTAAPVQESMTSAEPDRALRMANGSRPVDLNYKDERQRQALLGLVYADQRVTVDAVEAVQRVAGMTASQAPSEFSAGLEHAQHNALLESISAHTRAVLLNPGDGRMYEGLGDALRLARLETRAEAAYRTGLDLEPTSLLRTKLAELLWMRSAREAAIEEATAAIAMDPNNGRASADLARWYYFTGAYGHAWEFVHLSERLGASLPVQFRPLLANRMPEPRSERR